jgi:UDP-N-acetylglucosamine 4-epimerase
MRVLVTGGAGFIGSHVCEALLADDAEVVVYDDLSSGKNRVDGAQFIEGDIRDLEALSEAMAGCTHVCHLAALASVPASMADPALSEAINLHGTLNVIEAARANGVKRIVFSSTSAVYGDTEDMPVTETTTTRCLSPYAEDKLAAELAILNSGIEAISLRYFNVHGPRQDPNGAYAAVIPKFIESMIDGVAPTIFGDGSATRDFVRVQDVANLNLRSLTTDHESALGEVYNVASGTTMSVIELFESLRDLLAEHDPSIASLEAVIGTYRDGDIEHSSASIEKAKTRLGFNPETDPHRALRATVAAYWAQRA